MEITHRIEKDSSIVTIEGNIRSEDVVTCQDYLAPMLKDKTIRTLLISFRGMSYISSSALGLIVESYRKLEERKAKLIICGKVELVRSTLILVGLDNIIPNYPSEEEALSIILIHLFDSIQ